MRIKIVSDGTCMGTKIVDAKTGEKVEMIHKVEWSFQAGGIAEAKLHFLVVPVEMECEAVPVDAEEDESESEV